MGAPEDHYLKGATMGVFCFTGDESLEDLISVAQADPADDTAAMGEILRRYEGIVLAVARSVTGDLYLQQDAAQGARLGLVKAVRAHTLGTPGFASYAWKFMRGAARRLVISMGTEDVSTDPLAPVEEDGKPTVATIDTTFELVDLVKVLSPEQQGVALAYYGADLRVAEIAQHLGISKPAVSQRLSTIHRALRPVFEEAMAA
jgi:RNA polymerase sigma factor (sigma-70 family)